jgi:hypothetical protein
VAAAPSTWNPEPIANAKPAIVVAKITK